MTKPLKTSTHVVCTVQKKIATEKAFIRKANKKLENIAYTLTGKMWARANLEKRRIDREREIRNKKVAEKKRIRAANEKSHQNVYGLVIRMWVQVDKENNGNEKARIRALKQKSKDIHRMESTILPHVKSLYKKPRKPKTIPDVVDAQCPIPDVVDDEFPYWKPESVA
jgi:hypothetical protein